MQRYEFWKLRTAGEPTLNGGLIKACGDQVYNEIRAKGCTLLLAKVNPNGNITYHVLDYFGKPTGTYWSP